MSGMAVDCRPEQAALGGIHQVTPTTPRGSGIRRNTPIQSNTAACRNRAAVPFSPVANHPRRLFRPTPTAPARSYG